MKGLLIKDFYTLSKHARFMLLVVVVFALMPGSSMGMFAVVYTAMMPMYAMSYDERSKWDHLAAALPYPRRTIVLSRYLLGALLLGAVTLLSMAGGLVYQLLGKGAFSPNTVLGLTAVGLAFQALILPFLFKLGVEKGRMAYIGGLALLVGGTVALNSITETSIPLNAMLNAQGALALPIALALTALSIPISVKLYEKRDL